MNIATVLAGHDDPNASALIHDGRTITYGELVARVRAVQAGIEHELSHRPSGAVDGRVVIVSGTALEFVEVLFGVLAAGAVAAPLNPQSPPAELQGELDAIDPDIVFAGPRAADTVSACRSDAPIVALPGASLDGATAFADFVRTDGHREIVARDRDDLALLLFTSGTAGAPKPAMLSHGNLLANIEQLEALGTPLVDGSDVALAAIPLFHILGLNLLLGVTLRAGATVVLLSRFDPAAAAAAIADHGVTVISGPPTMWQRLADLPGADPAQFATVRRAISGAAPLTRAVANHVENTLGVRLTQGYGLTEAAPILTTSAGTEAPATSVGRPLPGVELRLVGPDGADVPVGDEGEIWARGPNIFGGYLDDPDATAAVLTADGWLRTGDLAVVDDDGYLYIVNRSKDLIVVSGFNVFPGEVEAVLRTHPGITDAAVIGVEHPRTGEAVKAVVVAADGVELEPDEVTAFARQHLARYKCPSVVEVVDELPVGPTGKVLRRDLRR